ncbi:RILP-like protein 1 isoform X3 [Nerophis ophidion]|uniref:RILP-like protein 1 isoform X3 n=1 Tax=Nerophis ophidion TaxID=159077 RepID=UPI002ADF0C11|nr:RILP-like protein 1 isoform X3 [Nerophis ophidion]
MSDQEGGVAPQQPRGNAGAAQAGIAAPPTATFTIKPPDHFDFTKPHAWEKWIRRFERFRLGSNLKSSSEANQELEQVDDMWRAEVQDLLSQITQLQAENKKLLDTGCHLIMQVYLMKCPAHFLRLQSGMSEKERQVKKLTDLVDKQRDELRAKDHELTLRNDDIEALQMQQHRLIRINQDLRHRLGVMEAQSKAIMQQRAELQAAAQARQQQMAAVQLEARCLRMELQECELEREVVKMEANCCSSTYGSTLSSSPQLRNVAPADSVKQNSVWVECGGDPGCSELHITSSASREINVSTSDREGDVPTLFLEEAREETDILEQESDAPRFTSQELRDVLQERNELKSQVFLMQEELAYYKSEEFEEDMLVCASASPSPPCSASPDLPESGIRRLIFTAIMPMVAAGLIADDPTLLPIRRLVSLV